VAECAVLVPELQSELEMLRERMTQSELPDDARYFRAVVGDEGVSVADDLGRRGSESREVTRTVRDERYHLSANSFFQTNIDLVPALIDSALGDVQGETAIELYSGVGLFTVALARRFTNVIAVEDDADATDFARRSLSDAGLSNTEVVNGDVADWLESEKNRAALQIDFLLLDPPRTGAESRVIAGIIRLNPKRICYVSCDPATLARDLKKLIAGGYSISSIRAFDMFPQTHHVETVVHLSG
jgi:23S rRNA (uracil1939-C5)-methyltransferase